MKNNREKTISAAAEQNVKNFEEVNATLKEVLSDVPKKQKSKVKKVFATIAKILFFPIYLIMQGWRLLSKKIKIRLTTKTTIIFTCMFGVLIIGYVIFVIVSLQKQLSIGDIDESYMDMLRLTSVILVTLFIVIGAVVGGMASQAMLNPIRKMINQIDEIDGDNLSLRLDEVDSQDELRELTNRINTTLDKLEDSFNRQANFVSDASHELKTPLSVIQGYAHLLKRWGKENPEILNEGIEAIATESVNMKKIVDQLLWLAKLGNFSLNVSSFDVNAMVKDIVDSYRVAGIKHNLIFEGGASIIVESDKSLLTEAVRTLVDNAVKYTPVEGSRIVVKCFVSDNQALISVADNGRGIAAEDLPKIFDRFYRCDKTRAREKGSSGLGLTICKSIIDTLGGGIAAESKSGEGSVFTVSLKF